MVGAWWDYNALSLMTVLRGDQSNEDMYAAIHGRWVRMFRVQVIHAEMRLERFAGRERKRNTALDTREPASEVMKPEWW